VNEPEFPKKMKLLREELRKQQLHNKLLDEIICPSGVLASELLRVKKL
jgi:hypothetical protein